MHFRFTNRNRGSALVITLFSCLAIGLVLASYLTLISSRYKLTVRSMNWNAAMPVVEAGIEEALAHLHFDSNSPSANGWTPDTLGGQPVHIKRREFSDGSYFYVTIYNAATNNPLIYSQGFVRSPLDQDQYISRTVKVTTTNPPSIFTRAIAANGTISLNGNSYVDGFDSRIGGYSTTTNRNASGGIATDSSAANAVSIGNGHVYGPVITGPGGGVSVGGGAVGDVAWNASNRGIQPGWTNNDMNVAFPTNAPPAGGPFLPPTTTIVGSSNIVYLGTGTNQMPAFSSGSSSSSIIVTGDAALWVTGDVNLSGGGYIQIMPGARLRLYVGGSASFSGGGIVNSTGFAANFSIIGLSSSTSVSFSGNSDFAGTINAPQAAITVGGGASIYGAFIGRTVRLNGTPTLHYDQALAAPTGLIVTGWKEM